MISEQKLQECEHAVQILQDSHKKVVVEVPGVKAEVNKDDNWTTIGMIVVLVLSIYLGIKLINKLVK